MEFPPTTFLLGTFMVLVLGYAAVVSAVLVCRAAGLVSSVKILERIRGVVGDVTMIFVFCGGLAALLTEDMRIEPVLNWAIVIVPAGYLLYRAITWRL